MHYINFRTQVKVLREIKIVEHPIILNIRILILILLSLSLSGCMPTNETAEVSQNTNYYPTQIALLLPMQSQNRNTNRLANNLKDAARLAAHDLKHLNLILTVYPTSGEPKRAAYAAKAAVADGNQIIVGPLFTEETYAVKVALKNETVKIISLSNDASMAGEGTFIMGTTFQSVANRLVAFAQTKGLQKIAIIGPVGSIGFNGIESAKSAIVSNDGVLSMVSTYPLNVSGIGEISPKIYLDLITSEAEAIIFTDSPTRGLGFITEEISNIFKKNKKKQPQFMGLTRWDSVPSILDEPSLNGGWFVVPDQRFKKQYADRYFKQFGITSNEISSLSYDAIAMIGGMVKLMDPRLRANVFTQKNFTSKNGFLGVNGVFRFDQSGESEHALSIAEVTSGDFKVVDTAKQQFMKNYN